MVALDGFVDAGNAARLAVEALGRGSRGRSRWPGSTSTSCVDYRSRRPPLRFDTDHWAGLHGTGAGRRRAHRHRRHAVPAARRARAGHAVGALRRRRRAARRAARRPAGRQHHGDPDGRAAHPPDRGDRARHPAGADRGPRGVVHHGRGARAAPSRLIEFRLGEAGHDAMGFAVHVPHYLARAEYPQAARVLLDHVGLAAGLYLPTEALSKAAERADAEIAEQVAGVGGGRAGGAGAGAPVRHGRRRPRRARRPRAWAASCPAPTSWPPRWSASSPTRRTSTSVRGNRRQGDDFRARGLTPRGPALRRRCCRRRGRGAVDGVEVAGLAEPRDAEVRRRAPG